MVAFGDSVPLPEWYLSYSREGIEQVDSDFEDNEPEEDHINCNTSME